MWSDLNFTTLGCQHLTDHLVIKRMINYTDFLAENAPVNFKRGDDFNQVSDLIIYDILFTITVFGSFYFISSLLYMEEFLLPQNKPILHVFEDTTNSKHRFHHFLYKDQNHNIGDIQNEDNYSPVGTFFK